MTQSNSAACHAKAPVWEQHCCLPLDPDADVDALWRYAEAGASFVSVNAGYAPHGIADTIRVLSGFRRQLLARPDRYLLARTAGDVRAAKATGRLAVAFDLEDTRPLDERIELVQTYYDLGVRTMVLTYNHRNAAGSGCHDESDGGLTRFGSEVVAEMNRVGMTVDAAHCSYRTSMDLFAASTAPVVLSHTAARAVHDHERNVWDDQMLACAATGGVVGINGVGMFLGANDASTETLVRHIDHAVELVGWEHVGLGLDYCFAEDDLNAELAANPELFPPSYSRWERLEFVEPERLPAIAAALLDRGHAPGAVAGILGGNFLRVAEKVWQ
ncbi:MULTISPECIES: dipeptidase [Amycolatopsis]|uniref:Membrane dipeptidase n=1 Tax=Amycolatopsis dendrobii TaxID=2760662 RepID=A0A7W3VSC6_9PSEU|nr:MULTISPECIES: membrane dipeptidase [Amycolatopsis]MBB1152215.1 membrane dipeptidase [Amycolatopsis dendrobii]UKD57510.1 dipeptidase [Amycolatopsis sp. FU40]